MASTNGVADSAKTAAATAQGQSAAAYGTVAPIYTQFAENPQGYSTQEKNDLLTSSNQALGGGVAAATGLAGLAAARTGNAGGYQTAIADAARSAGVQQSQNALNIDTQSDALARQQQQMGLAGLANIYSGANSTAVSNLNTANQAQKPLWQQLLGAAAGGASGVLTGR